MLSVKIERSRPLRLLCGLGALLGILSSFNAPASAGGSISMGAAAQVHGNCFIFSVNQPATIPYDPIVANLSTDATSQDGSLNVKCTRNAAAYIDLDHGLHATPAGSYFAPNMIGALGTPDSLKYFIYADQAHTQLWGTTTSADGGTTAGTVGNITGTGAVVQYTLYIVVPKNQNVQADSYSDSMVATVTY